MDPPGNAAQQESSKPYFCSVCGDNFKRHEHLIRHSRRHTQEKPFKCEVCHKEFARRDILSRHAIVHVPASERAALPQKTQKRGTKRVQQACNNCAKGKCRCDGDTPCSTCQSKGIDNCEYTLSAAPSKRKRADSSASTAAANVLLQVASSAQASPKGDWTLEYNPTPPDASMQPPQPIVFGYQPTLNGPLQLEPFMYGLSRPESRYTSRAPSPSHDFDIQYENAMPTTSAFGFLFKDSAKDLPGISAILPRLMSVPGYTSDFVVPAYGLPISSGEQPGTYSNYRNDSSVNINGSNIPRPPSPTLSFPMVDVSPEFQELEESPYVASFTEVEWAQLQEYTQTQLPSARLINILIQLYFDKFHTYLPILHLPNYSPRGSGQVLTLVIVAIGAHYFDQIKSSGLYQPLIQLAHRVIRQEPENFFTTLQAQFLLDIADLYSLQSQNALEAAENRRSSLLRRARAMKLFDESYNDSPPDDASTEIRWQVLRRAEERRRLSWAIWMYDNFLTTFFGVSSLMELNEVRTSLPCHEALWNSATAVEWAAHFAPDLLPLRTRTLWSIGRLEDRSSAEFAEYGVFCRTILAFVEARRVCDIVSVVISADPSSDIGSQDPNSVLLNAKEMSSKAFDILESSFSTREQDAGPEIVNALLNLQFARMITSIELSDIRRYLSGDDRGIRSWAVEMPRHARSAALSAAQITRLAIDAQASPFAGMITFFATVVLFCFAKFYPINDALHQLQLDRCSSLTVQAHQWIASGSFIPTVKHIGLLDQSNLIRLVTSWARQSPSNSHWGAESLESRMDSLSEFISE